MMMESVATLERLEDSRHHKPSSSATRTVRQVLVFERVGWVGGAQACQACVLRISNSKKKREKKGKFTNQKKKTKRPRPGIFSLSTCRGFIESVPTSHAFNDHPRYRATGRDNETAVSSPSSPSHFLMPPFCVCVSLSLPLSIYP